MAEANSVVQVFRDGTPLGNTTSNNSGHWSLDDTATVLNEGTYLFTVTSTDVAGNTSTLSFPMVVVIDRSALPPVIASITNDTGSSATDGITNDSTLLLVGTAEANSLVELRRDGSV